jgi:polyhydroxyalkanoate synthesis repressor PhaR
MIERTSTPIVVKRYGGARLYDTHAARYVSLEDIADMLRAERSVAIYDAGSGTDITPAVLAQIVARQH